jgi:hypothetical protein
MDFLDFLFPTSTTESGLAKEFWYQSRKGGFLYFQAFLCENEFLGLLSKDKAKILFSGKITSPYKIEFFGYRIGARY